MPKKTLIAPMFTLYLLSLIFVGSTAAVSAQTMVDVATDATDPQNLRDTEPSIAVNPRNHREISIVTFSEPWGGGTAAPVWRSTDGGVTWTKIRLVAQPGTNGAGPGDQHISYDSRGNLLLAELEIVESPPKLSNYIYRSNPAGSTYLAGMPYGDDQPHVAVDRSAGVCANRVYSPWLNTGASLARSMVSNSGDSGVNVNDLGAGDNATFPNRTTRVAVGNNGRVYAVYKTREGAVATANFENAHFRVIRSDDCGATWSALGPSGISVHGSPQVQTWFTNSFGNRAKGKVNRARSSDAWIAVDPSDDDVYVAYINRDSSGLGQIYVARSSDSGATWTSSRVTDGLNNSAFPEIAVADNGAIGVLFIDYDDSGPTTLFRHKFARSVDSGASWTRKALQSMDPGPIVNAQDGFLWGDYEGLTAAGNTFFGVFTGQSIGRSKLQLDPIFFTEPATQ